MNSVFWNLVHVMFRELKLELKLKTEVAEIKT